MTKRMCCSNSSSSETLESVMRATGDENNYIVRWSVIDVRLRPRRASLGGVCHRFTLCEKLRSFSLEIDASDGAAHSLWVDSDLDHAEVCEDCLNLLQTYKMVRLKIRSATKNALRTLLHRLTFPTAATSSLRLSRV